MIEVRKLTSTKKIKDIMLSKKFRGGYYCFNLDLISEVKDGLYKFRNLLCGVREVAYYIAYEENEPLIIMPVERKRNEAAILGVYEYFDFADIFYRDDVDNIQLQRAFSELLGYLKSVDIHKLCWNYLPNDSKSKELLLNNKFVPILEVDNVIIRFDDYQSHIKSLSKSTRQNLRTAENRLKKDEKNCRLISNYNGPIEHHIINGCIDIYFRRQKDKYGKDLLNQFMIKTINYSTLMMKKNKGCLMVLEIEGKVAAFMFGYINQEKNSYEVPKLAVNDDYAFYSPGMVLINRTLEYFENKTTIRALDLCRGTEDYKLKMGGEIYKTYNYLLNL